MGDLDIRFYLSILWRRLPCVAIAILVSANGVAITLALPSVYRATSKILIEAAQIAERFARSTVPVSGVEQIQVTEQRMIANANLLGLARKFSIYAEAPELRDSEIFKDMTSRTSFELIQFSSLPDSGTAAFTVSFDAEDPDLAAAVAPEITMEILQENTRQRTGSAAETLEFFEQSVKSLGAALTRLGDEMMRFKTKNKDALPDSLQFRRSEQTRQQERLALLEREEATLRDRSSRIIKLFENTGVDDVNPSATPEEQMLEQLRRTLAKQEGIYSDKRIWHFCDPASMRSRTKWGAQRAAHPNASEATSSSMTEALMKSLPELKQLILATPVNEVVLNSLELNYKNTQGAVRYGDRQAGRGLDLGADRAGLPGSLFFGDRNGEPVGEGCPLQTPAHRCSKRARRARSWARIRSSPRIAEQTIRRPAELVRGLEIQPFATIPYIPTAGQLLTRNLAFAAALLLVAAAIPALLFAIHYYFFPIDFLLSRLTGGLGALPASQHDWDASSKHQHDWDAVSNR